MKFDYDVLIVGGGPAGLSAALSLGRMSVRTLVVDDGRPRNAPSSHANNVPTRDGVHPAKWRELAREDLKKYPTVELGADSVVLARNLSDSMKSKLSHENPASISPAASSVESSTGQSTDSKTSHHAHSGSAKTAFSIELKSGAKLTVRNIVLAHGITDNMPEIEGFKDLWGKLIYHCPFCHGYEVRNQKLALIAMSPMAFHPLPMIASLSKDLVFLTNGEFKIDSDQLRELKTYGIRLDERKITRLNRSAHDSLSIHFDDGKELERDGAFATLRLPITQKSNLGDQLGCEKTEFGFYKLSERNETSVPGVFAAGDSATMMHSVVAASAAGSFVGAMLASLIWKK